MSEEVLAQADKVVEEFEGFSPAPYRCPAGVWTIGFGSTRDAQGHPVCATTPHIDVEAARSLVERDLQAALMVVQGSLSEPLEAPQEAALVDFVYNLGSGNFKSSTLLRKLNAGDLEGAAAEFDKWDRANGQVLAGLLRRREAERKLFVS